MEAQIISLDEHRSHTAPNPLLELIAASMTITSLWLMFGAATILTASKLLGK